MEGLYTSKIKKNVMRLLWDLYNNWHSPGNNFQSVVNLVKENFTDLNYLFQESKTKSR